MKVLLIEDENKVASFIKRGLENERFIVETINNGKEGLEMAYKPCFDIIILDIMLPHINGLTILRTLREDEIDTPIIVLTAKDSIEDKIQGLNLGADDYLAKPFSFGELLARIRAQLRRKGKNKNPIIKIKDMEINLMTHEVIRNNCSIDLTAKEYALLEFFINNADRAINRISIAEHVWNYDFDTGTNFVDVYINRLRNKINDKEENRLIHTIRGYGYILKSK